jgi:hypothetical protein
MTQKRVQVSAYAVLLIIGVSVAWGEEKKETSRELLPAPRCCYQHAGSSVSGCCATSDPSPCCAKKVVENAWEPEGPAGGEAINKIYPVGKLLWPAEPVILPVGNQELFLGWAVQTPNGPRLQEDCPEEELISLIRNTIQPMSWCDHGGPGTIDYFPTSQSLVVHQTPDIQEQIADLLAALGRLQEQQCSAAPAASMPVPPPAPVAPPPPGAPFSLMPPVMPPFAERVPPPVPFTGGLIPPPLAAPVVMPPAGFCTVPSVEPIPARKTYIMEAKWMEKKPCPERLSSRMQGELTGSISVGAGVNSVAELKGTVVQAENQESVLVRAPRLVFCPDPSFRGCIAIGDIPGKETGTWLLHVKAKQLKSGKLHLEVINIEGKAAKAQDGKVALNVAVTPVMDRKVKLGETVKKVLEKDADGTLRRWLELSVRELPGAAMNAVCPPPAGAAVPAPVAMGMMPVPCLTAPSACQPVCPGIFAEPVVPPRGEEESLWKLRVITEQGKSKLIVREGDRDSVTVKSLVVKIPGNDPLKLTAAGTQIHARSGSLQARADKVCRTGEAGCFLFEGHVKLTYKKDGELAKVLAERVLVNLADGRIEVQDAALICPAAALDD